MQILNMSPDRLNVTITVFYLKSQEFIYKPVYAVHTNVHTSEKYR